MCRPRAPPRRSSARCRPSPRRRAARCRRCRSTHAQRARVGGRASTSSGVSVPCQRSTSITRLWPALARRAPRLAGADGQRPVRRADASVIGRRSARRARPRRPAAARRCRARRARRRRSCAARRAADEHAVVPASDSGGASSATPASSCALARIFAVALAIAAGDAVGRARVEAVAGAEAVGVGGHDLDVERRDAELRRRRARRSRPSLPSASVVRLSTILPVGWTRRNTAR